MPKEAVEKKYPIEWYEPPRNKKTGKIKQFKYAKLKDVLSPEDFNWLTEVVDGKRRRVELNIFSPLEFIEYVKEKIKEAGIMEKVLPPVKEIENQIDKTIKEDKEKIVDDVINKNTKEITDLIKEIESRVINKQDVKKTLQDEFDDFVEIDPEEMRETVKTDLEDNPPESWRNFTGQHVREELAELPEWEEHAKKTINTSTNAKVITLLKSVLEEISKISDFANPV